MQTRKNQKGFTLIEMIVTVAIIASLAAILVPIVSSELGDTAQSRALGDAQRIGTAVTQFIKDARVFPTTNASGVDSTEVAWGAGTKPATNNLFDDGGDEEDLLEYLTTNASNWGGALWSGPYMQQIAADPWGNAFIVNVHGYYEDTEFVWVISAGPNGDIDTAPTSAVLQGDDIGVLID